MILRDTLEALLTGKSLSDADAGELLRALTQPDTAPPMAGALLAALRSKGVNADELRGFARAMRALARAPAIAPNPNAIDIVGTGGDSSGSFNLSTGAALLTAACGVDGGAWLCSATTVPIESKSAATFCNPTRAARIPAPRWPDSPMAR